MTQVDVAMVKCACADCVCIVPVDKAVKRDGKSFCCDACADGHKDGAGCHVCGCHG